MLKSLHILAFTRTQNANCRVMLKISYKCHQGAQTIIISLVIFAGVALKRENFNSTFSSFNSFPSLPLFATDDRK